MPFHDDTASAPDLLLDAILPRLRDADAGVRRLALIELAEWEDDAHLPWLHAALQDADIAVRTEAAERLAFSEDPASVLALIGALADGAAPVRSAAATSLAELRDTAHGEALLAALAGTDDGFTQASLLRALRELKLASALPPALALAASPHATVRLEAVGLLGWLKHRDALPVLVRVSQADAGGDGDAEVRRAAVGALGLAAEASAVADVAGALVAALQDPAWQVREEAATTLAKLRWAAALPALLQALDDAYWQVRLRATRALGRLKDSQASAALRTGPLRHEVANLRKEAAIALGEIADPSATDALLTAQLDSDPEVRKAARMALALIEAAARTR